jgi:hypothetical protein
MRFVQRLSHAFRKTLALRNIPTLLQTRMPSGDLTGAAKRQLYDMSTQDEYIARQVLAMAGDVLVVEQDTFGIDRKNKPRYLRRGQEVTISRDPLTFDLKGEARIRILDEGGKALSMRLSDFAHDIHANPRERPRERISSTM